MKVILPVAGKGERMRPYTNKKPKCLLPVGGKTIIDWIVEGILSLNPTEIIFITGYKADSINQFLKSRTSWGKTRTIFQNDPQGLGQAINLALPYIDDNEPLLIILGDTLFDANFDILAEATENILYTQKVKDPSRFGVAKTNKEAYIERLVEKPKDFVSNEAIVGIYYIKDVKELRKSIRHLVDNDIRTRGEFQLTDALQMMIENGCKFRDVPVQEWLDCGLPEALLQTNTWLMQNRIEASTTTHPTSTIISPCIIGKNVIMDNCTIGPNVSIGDNCTLKDSVVKDCIIWDNEDIFAENIEMKIIASC